jgi:cellulase
VWVKIQSSSFADGVWATDTLTKSKGKYTIAMPRLQAGNYLLRSEIVALHEGNKEGGAQLYVGCAQLKTTAQGGSVSAARFSRPQYSD